ncbi:disease resistance protein [Sesbania bispinosa]|nr:disease resistance protein [Sesbania bispinosa]
MPREDAGGGTSERLPKDEDFAEASNTEGSHSDDLFHQVNGKYPVSGKETISCGAIFGDASLIPIRKAINDLELLKVNKDLSKVSSDHATRCQLHNLLDTLCRSRHPKVTVEVKEAIVKFKTNFATIKSVNNLKNSEAERKEKLEAEIETLKKQLTAKEMDLQQLVLNLKNQDAKLSTCSTNCTSLKEKTRKLLKEVDDILAALSGTKDVGEAIEVMQNRLQDQEATLVSPYSTSCASLNERARARSLLKQADDLLATSNGIGKEHDGEVAEEEQNGLKWAWPTDLSCELNKIKSSILG